jgi:hypothetical protein
MLQNASRSADATGRWSALVGHDAQQCADRGARDMLQSDSGLTERFTTSSAVSS